MSETVVWGLGSILVTLIIGVPAYFAVKNAYTNRQSQRVDRGGIGYQAGRDMRVDREP